MFWWRRSCLWLTGLLALVYLAIYARSVFARISSRSLIIMLVTTTFVLLVARSSGFSALTGRPLVHPAALSLVASVCIALFLSTLSRPKMVAGFFYVTVWWALVCVLYWLSDTTRGRLGFVDSQVIYAAYIFMIGTIAGVWLLAKKQLPDCWIIIGVLFLLICLVLTQTRSALAITALFLAWNYRGLLRRYLYYSLAFTASIVILLTAGSFGRLNNFDYFVESTVYRLHLVQASLPSSSTAWILGGGIGSIQDNIERNRNNYSDLAIDPKEPVIFESSHNYLIDLVVERGLLVTLLMIYTVVRALRVRPDRGSPAKLVLVCTVGYLLVNNINLQMELILWIVIVWQLYQPKSSGLY